MGQSDESQWIIREVDGGVYTIENVKAGKFLNVAGGQDGLWANVHIWDNPGSPDSQWEIRKVTDGAFTLRSTCCDTYLNALGGVGDNVHMWNNPDSSHSQWEIQRV